MKTKRQVIIGWAQAFREIPAKASTYNLPDLIHDMLELLDERPDFTPTERHEIVAKTLGKHIDYLIDLQEGTIE